MKITSNDSVSNIPPSKSLETPKGKMGHRDVTWVNSVNTFFTPHNDWSDIPRTLILIVLAVSIVGLPLLYGAALAADVVGDALHSFRGETRPHQKFVNDFFAHTHTTVTETTLQSMLDGVSKKDSKLTHKELISNIIHESQNRELTKHQLKSVLIAASTCNDLTKEELDIILHAAQNKELSDSAVIHKYIAISKNRPLTEKEMGSLLEATKNYSKLTVSLLTSVFFAMTVSLPQDQVERFKLNAKLDNLTSIAKDKLDLDVKSFMRELMARSKITNPTDSQSDHILRLLDFYNTSHPREPIPITEEIANYFVAPNNQLIIAKDTPLQIKKVEVPKLCGKVLANLCYLPPGDQALVKAFNLNANLTDEAVYEAIANDPDFDMGAHIDPDSQLTSWIQIKGHQLKALDKFKTTDEHMYYECINLLRAIRRLDTGEPYLDGSSLGKLFVQ